MDSTWDQASQDDWGDRGGSQVSGLGIPPMNVQVMEFGVKVTYSHLLIMNILNIILYNLS